MLLTAADDDDEHDGPEAAVDSESAKGSRDSSGKVSTSLEGLAAGFLFASAVYCWVENGV